MESFIHSDFSLRFCVPHQTVGSLRVGPRFVHYLGAQQIIVEKAVDYLTWLRSPPLVLTGVFSLFSDNGLLAKIGLCLLLALAMLYLFPCLSTTSSMFPDKKIFVCVWLKRLRGGCFVDHSTLWSDLQDFVVAYHKPITIGLNHFSISYQLCNHEQVTQIFLTDKFVPTWDDYCKD